MSDAFALLLSRMQQLKDLSAALHLLSWDQETFLPKRGLAGRGAQLTTLQGLYHERLVDPHVGEWLEKVSVPGSLGPDEQAMVRELKRERDRAVKIPEALVRALADAQTEGLMGWRQARDEGRFASFSAPLETLLRLRREEADACAVSSERYDVFLDRFEPGLSVRRLSELMSRLESRLTPWVRAIADLGPAPKAPWETAVYPLPAQWAFTFQLLRGMGFDLQAGRQDESVHPFTAGIEANDVRLTTKLDERLPFSTFFSTLHEGGHGLYEQGFAPEHARTPLAQAASTGLHESQSRLWENQVGKSLAFWRYYYPKLVSAFPDALSDVSLTAFYTVINRVTPSLIRTDADELTYNLHIVLRYQLELALLRDDLRVRDLPSAWDEGMQRLLGVRPSNDVEGVLQDIHWSSGDFGYFPTYTVGNLYAASLYAAIARLRPGLEGEISRGELGPLLQFLRENIHRHGARTTAEERMAAVTGRGLQDEDFLRYLQDKFRPLYPAAFAAGP